ncbi:HAD family hydrolase [Streptomyces sp. H27-D2]|uniref:HAD family hydrolase n=1 Tax=Streptomyces sp. H27-D2 TaxID=3046304 RepID=UPI002DB60DF5|nr:HAD family phosphatase [Streptomyces sp. H27-D2]MEC4020057.1 HAD family phosphatase [Streptomyces sp. H27-D2]
MPSRPPDTASDAVSDTASDAAICVAPAVPADTAPGRLPAGLSAGLPAALLCDMDGTLVDTEREWLLAVAALLDEEGLPSGEAALAPFAGATLADSAARLIEQHGLRATREELFSRLDGDFTRRVAAGVAVQPGALAFLDRARALGVPTALVTASERHLTDLVLETLGAHRFDLTVAGTEGGRSKPYPDPYLAAATRLGADPADCLAVEDTPTGAAAALAAGCRLLAVPTVPGIEPGPRTLFAASLVGLDPAALPLSGSLPA